MENKFRKMTPYSSTVRVKCEPTRQFAASRS